MRRIEGITPFSPIKDRLLAQCQPVTESGCWIWTGNSNRTGYGLIKDNYKTRSAHRVSYELFISPIPDRLHVLHRCDVRCCVNPSHLFLGTSADNSRDMISKGRARFVGNGGICGEEHWNCRLTAEKVAYIRQSTKGHKALAIELGVSPRAIFSVRSGRTWRHVK